MEAWGPEFAGAEFAGAEARVSFRHADGLRAGDGGEVRGFVLAGRDGVFHPASARVDGATVIATCPEVPEPAAVRYAWANLPSANLVNAAGLPAAPFRSDAPAGN